MSMKKALSFLMCVCIFASVFSVNASADEKKETVPTVLVSGFLCSKLFVDYGTENEQSIWKYLLDGAARQAKEDFSELASSFFGMINGSSEDFGKTVGEGAAEVLELLECPPDGSAGSRIGIYPNTPEKSNLAYLLANAKDYMYEVNFCTHLSQVTDPSSVFCFNYDSRLDAVTLADELALFIDEIIDYTGSDKVKIFALSYGGLITATYLTKYGSGEVERVVMSVPALGGTDLPERVLTGDADLADESIVAFISTILDLNSDPTRFFDLDRIEWLDGFAKGLCTQIADTASTWGSVWSLSTTKGYNQLKNQHLDAHVNAELINKLDYIHNTVRPNLSALFNECISNGTPVSILCGTGSALVGGGTFNGDVILPASGVSGAKTAPLGTSLTAADSCGIEGHFHLSPSGEVDASCAYLPENTWFIENHRHGQYYYEEYTRSLVTKLLFTDDITDVYSDPAYPQFANSNHSFETVALSIGGSPDITIRQTDNKLTLKNVGTENSIKILSVLADGAEIDFADRGIETLAPGESADVGFTADFSAISVQPARITVSYIKIGSLTPLCVSEFYATAKGEAPPSAEYKAVNSKSRLEENISPKVYDFLRKTSLAEAAQCVYNTYISIKKSL